MAVKFKTKVKMIVPDGPPQKLAEAVAMYQPVKGTSSASVYSVVAVSSSLKVAVRLNSEKLSVRVEGSGISKPEVKKALSGLGFQETADSHFSMHMSCGTVPIDRVIGAILVGIGGDFDSPLPKIEKVKAACK